MTYARRITVALIGLLAVVSGSKWLFDGKRLPTLVLVQSVADAEHSSSSTKQSRGAKGKSSLRCKPNQARLGRKASLFQISRETKITD